MSSWADAAAAAADVEARKELRRARAGVAAAPARAEGESTDDDSDESSEDGDSEAEIAFEEGVAIHRTASDFKDEDEGVWVGKGAAGLEDAIVFGMEWTRSAADESHVHEGGESKGQEGASAGTSGSPSSASHESAPWVPVPLAIISGDFAVQNTALSLGIPVCGLSGRRVAHRRTWALRCTACMELCRDQERVFCPSCGNSGTLRRVGVEHVVRIRTDAAGVSHHETEERLILARNFQPRIRGTVFSVPDRNSRRAKRRERTRAGIRAARAPAVLADAAAQGRGGEAALGGSGMSAGQARLGKAGRVGRLLVSEDQLRQGAWASLARGDRKAALVGSRGREDLGLAYGAAPARELIGTAKGGGAGHGDAHEGGPQGAEDAFRVRGLPRVVVGLGAGNPNARKGRERRGKGGRIR